MDKRILLSNGEWTLVSDADWLFLVGFNWNISNSGYAQASAYIDGETQYMHRVVAKRIWLDLSNDIDHVNGDKLDNRRENLRAATRSQNQINGRHYKSNRVGFRGVSRNKDRWKALIVVNGSEIHLGTFDTPEEASEIYQEAAKHYFGEFAIKIKGDK